MVAVVTYRAERRAAPKPARWAMCLRLNAASIAVPSGDRSMYSSDEGPTHV